MVNKRDLGEFEDLFKKKPRLNGGKKLGASRLLGGNLVMGRENPSHRQR
jgi:hypothetical protein